MHRKLCVVLAIFTVGGLGSWTVAQEAKTIPETAVAAGQFETLVAAVKAAGLLETLGGAGPFTVLAPTDEAFKKLPEGTVASLLKPENKEKLVQILKYHVAADRLTSDMASPGANFPNLAGLPLKVDVKAGTISIGNAKILKTDIRCSNGVIHVLDTVLIPESKLDKAALVGTWEYVSAVKNGEEKSAEDLKGQFVKITQDKWTLDGEAKFVMDYEVNTSDSPNTVKFTITDSPFGAGMSAAGVIKLEGKELVVCYAPMGEAPSEFDASEGSGNFLFRLKKK